jgi:sialic acid synthase SpsE
MTPLTVSSRSISPRHPTLVIAEIGVNHDGSLVRALDLVERAKRAGADAVKLQIFRAQSLLHPSACFAAYQKDRCPDPTPADMLARYELSPADLRHVIAAIRAADLIPLATPFSPSDLDTIGALNLPAIKIASPDLINHLLLERAAALGKPLLLSTGAASLDEIAAAVEYLRSLATPFALLHCISAYPTPPDQANLCWIKELSVFGVPVGFSDHTTEELTGALAVAAGASFIEKHLTYDRSAPGPDHSASADPAQFADYVRAIRLADQLRGFPGKHVLPIENDVRTVSRQSLVTTRDLSPSDAIQESDLTTQRPATGIPPSDLKQVLGKHPTHPLPAGIILQWPMLT